MHHCTSRTVQVEGTHAAAFGLRHIILHGYPILAHKAPLHYEAFGRAGYVSLTGTS